jgi:hypothetical protein
MTDLDRRKALIARRVAEATGAPAGAPTRVSQRIVRRVDQDWAALTDQQLVSWRHHRGHPESTINNLGLRFTFGAPVDIDGLFAAVQGFCRRHELFRTTYELVGRRPMQRVHEQLPPQCSVERLDRRSAIDARVGDHMARPFDLAREGPLRVVAFDVAGSCQDGLLTVHHIVWDAKTFDRLTEDLDALYRDRDLKLVPDPVQYADFAQWYRARTDEGGRELDFWLQRLTPLPELPLRGPDMSLPRTERGERIDRGLTPRSVRGLNDLARRGGSTRFVAFTSCLGLAVSEQFAVSDVCIGTLASMRERPELRSIVGDFSTMLPLRFSVAGGPVEELVRRVDLEFRNALDHSEIHFDTISSAIAGAGDAIRPAVCDVLVVFIEGDLPGPTFGSAKTRWTRVPNGNVQFPIVPLGIEVFLRTERPEIQFTYSTEIISTDRVSELADRLERYLEEAGAP